MAQKKQRDTLSMIFSWQTLSRSLYTGLAMAGIVYFYDKNSGMMWYLGTEAAIAAFLVKALDASFNFRIGGVNVI